jgi:enoyl-CoA hydratase/carnithine racemase
VRENELGTPHLRFEREGSIAWCTIDRPAKRNALTPAMYFGIRRAVHLVEAEPGLGALVLTGVGDVFAPGGDLGGRTEPGEEPVPAGVGPDILPFLTVRDSRVPVISAVNGLCQGGGLLIAMLSDVAVASARATFRAPELLRGIPDAFYAAALPAHVGIAVARDLLLTGRVLDAEEARALGLIARVVPHDQLREAAVEAAHQVLRTAPDARAHVKRMLNERYGPIDTQTMNWSLATSAELREGMAAFMEKRPPAWTPPDVP